VTKPRISLVIPVRNEEESIENLIESIARQTHRPDEVVLVDGGSTDRTVEIVEGLINNCFERGAEPLKVDGGAAGEAHPFRTSGEAAKVLARLKLLRTDGATPGKGRNIGIEAARNEWIALTDAGIRLEPDWLEELLEAAEQRSRGDEELSEADIVYGNYSPSVTNLFEKCALISYAPPKRPGDIRARSVVSMLLRKEVWKKVGGFPDMRAAEDLMFMESAEAAGFGAGFAPKAMAHWELRPDVASTFRKFVLYSKHNVWAGRQWDWHYGIAKQYLLIVPFLVLAMFHSWWWLLGIPLWLFARTAKRILAHRYEFGVAALFNPLVFFGVAGLILVIDAATFVGWGEALGRKQRAVGNRRSE
jgi:glycosyltransferase involved in cell wall biosynthesis